MNSGGKKYQSRLNAKTADLERCQQEHQINIATQLQIITDLPAKASVNQKLEQQNLELHNRSENMKDEVGTLKPRIKVLQNDPSEERNQVNELKKYGS